MILRKVIELRQGDWIVLKHPRYGGTTEYEVIKIMIHAKPDLPNEVVSIWVKTLAKGMSYGPEIEFRLGDMVQVTAES
jgi:hypothetical protein